MENTITLSRSIALRLRDVLAGSRCNFDIDHPLIAAIDLALEKYPPELVNALALEYADVEKDPRGRKTYSFDSYGLQSFAAAAAWNERQKYSELEKQHFSTSKLFLKDMKAFEDERDRLRSALKGFYDNSIKADWPDDIYDNASKALAGEELNKKYVGGVLD